MADKVKQLLVDLEATKDRNSPKARLLRRLLRKEGHSFRKEKVTEVTGKKESKKVIDDKDED